MVISSWYEYVFPWPLVNVRVSLPLTWHWQRCNAMNDLIFIDLCCNFLTKHSCYSSDISLCKFGLNGSGKAESEVQRRITATFQEETREEGPEYQEGKAVHRSQESGKKVLIIKTVSADVMFIFQQHQESYKFKKNVQKLINAKNEKETKEKAQNFDKKEFLAVNKEAGASKNWFPQSSSPITSRLQTWQTIKLTDCRIFENVWDQWNW